MTTLRHLRPKPCAAVTLLLVALFAVLWATKNYALLDICGCSNNPNTLGAFDTLNANTYPAGTISQYRHITLPLPADGILVFDSMNIKPRPSDQGALTVDFQRNAANSPVTLLVRGNVTINDDTNTVISISGASGQQVGGSDFNRGGLGGPGGFRGGDGAYQLVNLSSIGGAGFGPLGGGGGTGSPITTAGGGQFLGALGLLPLVGGSGGGGGGSGNATLGSNGGSGGGGGGAILIAANGTVTMNGQITARGGEPAGPNGNSNSTWGGGGSGGAVRIVANAITGTGSISAIGGSGQGGSQPPPGPGMIRLEAFQTTLSANNTNPVATRALAPGPIVNPFTPQVSITAVAGQPIPPAPQGPFGGVDVTLPGGNITNIDLATTSVPTGTAVQVSAKPRFGALPTIATIPLINCDGSGACLASVAMNLAAGNYVIEARATFQTP